MHPRLVIHDAFRLDRELLSKLVLIIELCEESQSIAGAMLLPDCLRPTPPGRQSLISVEPVRLAVHKPFPVPWKYRLEGFRDTKRDDAFAQQHGPDELCLDNAFQGRQMFPRLLVISSLKRAHSGLARGHA